jgi:hypothetical protein
VHLGKGVSPVLVDVEGFTRHIVILRMVEEAEEEEQA